MYSVNDDYNDNRTYEDILIYLQILSDGLLLLDLQTP